MAPLFAFFNTFPATIHIGDTPLPVKVRRFTRTELDAFDQLWDRLVVSPRGTATPVDEDALEAERLRFFEESICNAITLEAGLVQDNERDVVDGAGLIAVFHSRKDVLSALLGAIYWKNHLTDIVKKTSSLPPGSVTGSAASTPAPGGDAPAPIAAPAGSSSTAAPAAATDETPVA